MWLATLEQRPLWDPDEGRYAEIPREMVTTGDWVTPRLNGLLYLEKPPLQYWATALAYTLFGEHHWTSRLWAGLTGLGGVLLAFYAGARLQDVRVGVYAAAMLASSLLYFGLGHFNTLDMGLTFFLESALFALVFAFHPQANARERSVWIHLAWAAAGLAVLSKGLIGLVLPLGAAIGYSILYRDATIWRKTAPITGSALFLVIVAPWFLAVIRANPDFSSFFFVHEHFSRFLTTQHHRGQPWWFLPLVLVVGALPWTVLMLVGWWRAFFTRERSGFDPFGFLAVWVLVVFAFFSASGSKMAPYLLPLLPALALLGARNLVRESSASIGRSMFISAPLAAAALAVAPYALSRVPGEASGPGSELERALLIASAPWVVGIAAVIAAEIRKNRDAAVVSLALSAMAAGHLSLLGASEISPRKSTLTLAQQLKPQLQDSTRIYVLEVFPPSLPAYLGRTVILVGFKGELEFGLAREPHKALSSVGEFVPLWSQERDAVAVMTPSLHRELEASGLPMSIIARDAARVAVRRP
jgi:4-amino-4-deoxy-L-arabinose transferase-like glycosyltransferase